MVLDPTPGDRWNPLVRVAFRFWLLWFLGAFLTALPQLAPVVGGIGSYALDQALQPVVVWVGRTVFGLEITVFPNGSGDTTYNWVFLAITVAFAAAGAALWSALDWRRPAYPWLKDGLWIAMRFTLALAMLGYGVNKVFGLQFPEPSMQRLLQDYGDSSPMGLMWTFMGASPPYVRFAGWMETIGGLLLLFRRTQLLGALWTAGLMTNVFVLNMCYDIPVKIYSFSLLAVACVIAAPDALRLARVFVLNAPAAPADLVGPWTNRPLRITAAAVKFAWIALVVPLTFWQQYQMQFLYGAAAPKGPLDGTWEVESFRRDGVKVPPLTTDATRWRHLTLVDRPEFKLATASRMKGPGDRWMLSIVPSEGSAASSTEGPGAAGRLEFREVATSGLDDPLQQAPVAGFDFVHDGEKRLRLSGELGGTRLEIECVRLDPRDFLLVNRGFRWVNESPFNR